MAPPKRLTEHFDYAEFDCRDGSPVPAAQRPAISHLAHWWLEPFRAEFGRTTILSGYRTARHNASVGGARASVHMLTTALPSRPTGSSTRAAAADVRAERGTPSQWAAWARRHRARNEHLGPEGRGGIGTYLGSGFVHLDTAQYRDWRG